MDIINQFLREENARAIFSIVFNGKRYNRIECLIKFLFIQFGTTNLRGFLFMPDYTISSDEKTQITFTHNKDKKIKIMLIASNDQDIKLWYPFAINSNNSFQNFLSIVSDSDLAFEEDLGIEKHEYILKVTSDFVFTLVDSGKCIINYTISSRTTVTLSNFDEQPRIGLYDFNPEKITWVTIPDLSGLFRWTLLFKCCLEIAAKKEEEEFKVLEIQDIAIEPSSKDDDPNEGPIVIKNDDNPELTSPDQESKKNTEEDNISTTKTPHFSSTAVPKFDQSPTVSFSQSTLPRSKRNSNDEMGSRNRRLSCDAQMLNKYNLEVKKQMDELMIKKNNYRKTINIPEPLPEPEIEPPVIVNYSRINSQNKPYAVVEKAPNHKMTKDEMMEIIQPHINRPVINFNRYIPNYVFYNFKMPAIDFIPEANYPENFKSLFYRSLGQPRNINSDKPQKVQQRDPKLTFLLLSTIIGNGFRGSSVAEAYKIPKQSNMMYDILSAIRKYKKDIFNYILSINENDLQTWYAPWSIIRSDRSFIEEINDRFIKNQESDGSNQSGDCIGPIIIFEPTFPMPENVPFQFAFRPFEFILKFLFDAIYFQRISFVNPVIFVTSLSKMLFSLFSHYLVFEVNETTLSSSTEQLTLSSNSLSSSYFIANPVTVSSMISSPVSIQTFVKDILSKVKPLKKTHPPWSYLSFQQDFSQSWAFFWASCFQTDSLAENFSEFFKYPEILKKFYYPCSSMRNCQWIQYITEILNVISQIGLPKNFEINAATLFPSTTQTTGNAFTNAINDNKIIKNLAGLIGIKS